MKEFRIRENGFKEIKKRLIVTMSIMFSAIFLIVILLPAVMSEAPERFNTLPYLIVMFVGISVFSIWTSIKKQRPLFESFVLRIDDEKVVREKLNTPTLSINRNDITKITKHANGSFSVQGKSKLNPIIIPTQIEDYQLLESMLTQLKLVTVLTSKNFVEKMFIPISLSGAVLMGITYISKNETIILICSILIVSILSASLVLTQMNKNIDKKTKRLGWLVLIPLAVFVSMIISGLSA